MSKKLESVNEVKQQFEEYFKEDLDAIEEELSQSKKYSDIIDGQIENLSVPGLGMNKGSQHYLIEHINNAISLQTQRQGLRKDRFTIKKAILDFSTRFADNHEDSSEVDIIKVVKDTIAKATNGNIKQDSDLVYLNDSDLDNEIDKKLGDLES